MRQLHFSAGIRTCAVIASLVGIGAAAPAAWAGFAPVQSCSSSASTIKFQPGLVRAQANQTATLSGTVAGCSHLGGTQETGSGSIAATLSGQASTSAVMLSWAFTINWPASSGLSPSQGTLSVTGPKKGVYTVSGQVNSGAFSEGVIRTAYKITGASRGGTGTASPVTLQTLANTSPLQVLFNFG